LGAVDKSASVDASESVLDGLLWPAPVADSDIMWLDEPEPTAPSTPTITPSPAATAPAPASANPSSATSARPSVAASPAGHRPFVPLSHLLSADVAYEWHEAVALVQQLIDQLIPDRTRLPVGSIPQIEAIALGSSGRLRAQLDPTRSELLVAGLGQLLHRLLQDKPGPANLRLMAWQAASGLAAPVSIEELMRQLAGWERPGRLEKLAKLYERALAAAPVQAAAAVPVQVEVQAPNPLQEREPPKPSTSRIRSLQMAAAAGLIAAACVTAVVVVRPIVQTSSESPLTPEGPLAAKLWADIQLPASTIGERARQAASAAARPARRTALRSGEPPDPNMVTTSADETREDFEGAPRSPGGALIYTSDDHSVIEPVLIFPYLPLRARSGVTEDKLGVLELVVDTRGHVESVHLRSPSNRYRERWWVFVSKSWQFRPALKDGKPVRFLKRVALTDLNLAEPQ
jgi:hypothetical protein